MLGRMIQEAEAQLCKASRETNPPSKVVTASYREIRSNITRSAASTVCIITLRVRFQPQSSEPPAHEQS